MHNLISYKLLAWSFMTNPSIPAARILAPPMVVGVKFFKFEYEKFFLLTFQLMIKRDESCGRVHNLKQNLFLISNISCDKCSSFAAQRRTNNARVMVAKNCSVS